MTGINRTSIAKHFIRMINLVAFDICEEDDIQIFQAADPLSFIIKCRSREGIDPTLHAHLRRCIKSEGKRNNVLIGKIKLDHSIEITVYQKSLRKAAYVHGESPQDKDS